MILLVDDEGEILTTLSEILLAHDYTVIACSSAHDALEVFTSKRHNISTVITDFLMPEMNGVELIRAIHQENPLINAILCSGLPPENIGVNNVIAMHKPINIQELIEQLGSFSINKQL
ncbi:MAG: response regulator [Ghiorsea sp.]